MESPKSVLVYVVGLVALVASSIVISGRMELAADHSATMSVNPAGTRPSPTLESNCSPLAMSFSHSMPDPPFTTTLTSPGQPRWGEPLFVSGTVYAADGNMPLAGAMITVWQANADGSFGRSEILSARMRTDFEGRYEFSTVKPGHYEIDCELLPAHIHYQITYLDSNPMFQTLFFAGDPYLGNTLVDPTFIRPLTPQAGADGPFLQVTFDPILPVEVGAEVLEVENSIDQ